MYNSDEEYLRATRDAQVNIIARRERRGILLFINFLLFLALSIIVFLYFTQGNNYLSENIFGKKTAVLSATHRSPESGYSDEELMVLLRNPDTKTALESSTLNEQDELTKEMNQVMSEISIKSKSNYESAISQELDDKSKDVKGRIVVVKKGDTLSSLAEEYYGNSMAFHEIIVHNKSITEQSHTLYVGQKINIPY